MKKKSNRNKPDTPPSKIQVGDKVKFDSSQSEVYPYDVPENNEDGIVQLLTINVALNQLMGVELEMALVKFSKVSRLIYIEHLTVIESASKESINSIVYEDLNNDSNIN